MTSSRRSPDASAGLCRYRHEQAKRPANGPSTSGTGLVDQSWGRRSEVFSSSSEEREQEQQGLPNGHALGASGIGGSQANGYPITVAAAAAATGAGAEEEEPPVCCFLLLESVVAACLRRLVRLKTYNGMDEIRMLQHPSALHGTDFKCVQGGLCPPNNFSGAHAELPATALEKARSNCLPVVPGVGWRGVVPPAAGAQVPQEQTLGSLARPHPAADRASGFRQISLAGPGAALCAATSVLFQQQLTWHSAKDIGSTPKHCRHKIRFPFQTIRHKAVQTEKRPMLGAAMGSLCLVCLTFASRLFRGKLHNTDNSSFRIVEKWVDGTSEMTEMPLAVGRPVTGGKAKRDSGRRMASSRAGLPGSSGTATPPAPTAPTLP